MLLELYFDALLDKNNVLRLEGVVASKIYFLTRFSRFIVSVVVVTFVASDE